MKKKETECSVVLHGSMHEEKVQDDLQVKYPVCFCPECSSIETRVIEQIKDKSDGWHSRWYTGRTVSDTSSVIFDREAEIVCYECSCCGCQWYKEYLDKKTKWVLEDKVYQTIFCIIGLIASVFIFIFGILLLEKVYSCSSWTSVGICIASFIGSIIGGGIAGVWLWCLWE